MICLDDILLSKPRGFAGLQVVSHVRSRDVLLLKRLAPLYERYRGELLPDYAAVMGRAFSLLARCSDVRRLRELVEGQRRLRDLESKYGLRVREFIEELFRALGSRDFTGGLSLVSEGLPLTTFHIAPAVYEAGFKVYLEPHLLDYGKTFDLLAVPSGGGPIRLIEVKRVVKRLRKAKVADDCLRLLAGKVLPIFSVQRNLGPICIDLIHVSVSSISSEVRRYCASLARELSEALTYLGVAGFKIWACHYERIGDVARRMRGAPSP